MARHVREEHLLAIEDVLREHPEGRTASQIHDALTSAPPHRTLQYRLKSLVDSKRLIMEGTARWARYRLPRPISLAFQAVAGSPTASFRLEVLPPLSTPGAEIREYVRQPWRRAARAVMTERSSIRTGPTRPSTSRKRNESTSGKWADR